MSNEARKSVVVVTGSRDADAEAVMDAVLTVDREELDAGYDAVWWQGGCPTGADAAVKYLMDTGVIFIGLTVFADWKKYGKAAGPIRNASLMKQAASLRDQGFRVRVLAFPAEGATNKGTEDAIRAAESHGLTVERKVVPMRKARS